MYRKLTKQEYEEAKRLFELQQEQNRKHAKITIYDLYCKSLRRVGNYYKNYKEYKLALNIFLQIKEFGFE
jgi:hypothetical protein